MEKLRKKLKLRQRFGKDLYLRIAAVVLAVVIWVVLSMTLYPQIQTTVNNVPVTLKLSADTADGLEPVNFDAQTTVNVQIKGMRYEIGNYSADDLKATVDLAGVNKDGTYDLNVDVTSRNGDSLDVLDVSPAKVKVRFDYIKKKQIPVTLEAPNISADEGFLLTSSDNALNVSEIAVEGPQREVDQVDHAVYRISEVKSLSESYTTGEGKLILYDESNAPVDQTDLTIDGMDGIKANFTVYEKKTLNLKLQILGMPANFNESSLKYTLSENSIDVAAPIGTLTATEKIIGSIGLNTIDLNYNKNFPVTLESTVVNSSGIDNVTAFFDTDGYTAATYSIDDTQIQIKNIPAGMTVTTGTKKISGIRMIGPEASIGKLKAENLIASLDMAGSELDTGTYTRVVTIYSPVYDDIWAFGTYEITINVTR
ncbi:MAG: CdaR family protein [Oscillospiraceae bacterium]